MFPRGPAIDVLLCRKRRAAFLRTMKIAKHSGATEANVSIRKDGDWLRIVVSDNGKGGADLMAGTGLRGLQDRIAALDGRFAIESPKGVGTSIMVVIPCG